MGVWAGIASLLLLAGDGAAGAGSKEVPAGCEKRCEKQTVPCTDGRAEDQMMCFEVVRRCEIRCDPQARASGAGRSQQAKK